MPVGTKNTQFVNFFSRGMDLIIVDHSKSRDLPVVAHHHHQTLMRASQTYVTRCLTPKRSVFKWTCSDANELLHKLQHKVLVCLIPPTSPVRQLKTDVLFIVSETDDMSSRQQGSAHFSSTSPSGEQRKNETLTCPKQSHPPGPILQHLPLKVTVCSTVTSPRGRQFGGRTVFTWPSSNLAAS